MIFPVKEGVLPTSPNRKTSQEDLRKILGKRKNDVLYAPLLLENSKRHQKKTRFTSLLHMITLSHGLFSHVVFNF